MCNDVSNLPICGSEAIKITVLNQCRNSLIDFEIDQSKLKTDVRRIKIYKIGRNKRTNHNSRSYSFLWPGTKSSN